MNDENFAERIKDFFNDYELSFKNGLAGNEDTGTFASFFADCFVEANPKGVSCEKNNEELRKSMATGYERYRKMGTKEMTIQAIVSSKLLEFHYMAKVDWLSIYKKQDNSVVTIEFRVVYLLQDTNNMLKIFSYITGDEEAVLKQYGLI